MIKNKLPTISVVMPTLNSQRTLDICLRSIASQDYQGKVEIVIADGGSSDGTLKIAKRYKTRIIYNKLKTGEAGKAIGARSSKGEILAFIDSDNILPTTDWLNNMIEPFLDDKEIVASEPLYFTYRRQDHWLTRYFALLGMGDPLTLFIGNYDRYSYISDKWTELEVPFVSNDNYLALSLKKEIPTIGANGFLIRKKILKKYPIKDYLFDIDVLKFLTQKHSIKVAKVKIGLVHLFSGNIATFVRKQRRRIRDYIYFQKNGIRIKESNQARIFWGVCKFVLETLFILPILYQMIVGLLRKRDWVWMFHPLACWLTLLIYGQESLRSIFIQQQFDRKKWSQ